MLILKLYLKLQFIISCVIGYIQIVLLTKTHVSEKRINRFMLINLQKYKTWRHEQYSCK